MQKKKKIEMICKGNVGRSPVAELIAKQYLESTGAIQDYEISSSGSVAGSLINRTFPREMLTNSMSLFSSTGLHDESFEYLRSAWEQNDEEKIKKYTAQAIDYVVAAEMKKRNEILRDLGINGTPKQNPEQTIVKSLDYIFAIDRKVYGELMSSPNGIYQGVSPRPAIHVLSVFATGNEQEKDSEVDLSNPDNVWKSYRDGLIRIIEQTPLAMRRIIS